VNLVRTYQALSDPTRVRIVHLLGHRSLCVCHIQEILGASQVKVSKHLAYLKDRGVVAVEREANWRIYRLVSDPSRVLKANLDAIKGVEADDPTLSRDLARLRRLQDQFDEDGPICTPKLNRSSARAS
jgi:DNA-binding transcriptional ArsR family regulator